MHSVVKFTSTHVGLVLLLCVGVENLSLPPGDDYLDELNPAFDEDFPGLSVHHSVARRSPKYYDFRSVNNEKQLIPNDYNILERPTPPDGTTTKVNFSVILFSVRGIDEKEEKITLEMNLRMFWQDTRLVHLANQTGNGSYLVLNTNLLQDIWHPDVYIDHAISISQPSIVDRPASLRIYANSVIRYSARLTVTMACRMDFHFYPVDTQKCHIQLKSYAYNKDLTEFSWLPGNRGAFQANKLDLPNFDVALDKTNNFTTITSSGVYTNLQLVISLRRKLSYHLIQTYLPSSIFLIVSWLSFLIPKESVPERIGSCMMTLLTLTVMFGSVGQSMPKVSYLTALDIWMVTCIVFVFIALIEFTVVLKLWSLESAAKAAEKKEEEEDEEEEDDDMRFKKGANNGKNGKGAKKRKILKNTDVNTFEMKEPNSYKNYKVFNNCNSNPAFSAEPSEESSQGHVQGEGQGEGHYLNVSTTTPEHEYETVKESRPDRGEGEADEEAEADSGEGAVGGGGGAPKKRKPSKIKNWRSARYVRIAKVLEKVTSVTLPCLFIVFNWIYWPWLYLSSDEASNKE